MSKSISLELLILNFFLWNVHLNFDGVLLLALFDRLLLFLVSNFLLLVLMCLMNLHEGLEIRIVLDLLVVTIENDLSFLHHDDPVNQAQEVNGVRDKNSGLMLQVAEHDLLKD